MKHDINPLAISATTTLAALQPVSFVYNDDASSTVRYGFIAEDTAAVDSHLGTYGQSGSLSGVDDRALLAIVVNALKELMREVGDFAERIVSKQIVATQSLCINKSDGTAVCITGDQLAAILASTGQQATGSTLPSNTSTPNSQTLPASSTRPVIKINGENPAIIHIGDAYADLGATIVSPDADKNLGISTYLNGTLTNPFTFVLDTSTISTSTIDYVVTDAAGLAATSTRTVVVQAAASSL